MNIGVVGLGLIGGSICKALRSADKNIVMYGYDKDSNIKMLAHKQKCIDIAIDNFSQFSDCEVVFVAVPCELTTEIVNEVAAATENRCIITDCASVKHSIIAGVTAEKFVGGHPMAGVENAGLISSRSFLFENAYYILCGDSSKDYYGVVENLVLKLKAIPINMTDTKHDEIVSKISHLPHMVAYALVNTSLTSDYSRKLAAGGFKDITRIASSSPKLWTSIALKNTDNICNDIDKLIEQLKLVKGMMATGRIEHLASYFESGKEKRDSLLLQSAGINSHILTLKVVIEDKIGSIANVTKILSKNKISLANINIENSREGDDGVLSLRFFDVKTKNKAAEALAKGGVICLE